MATLVGIKVPRKKVRAAPRVQRGSKMKEPSWDGWELGPVNSITVFSARHTLGIMRTLNQRTCIPQCMNG